MGPRSLGIFGVSRLACATSPKCSAHGYRASRSGRESDRVLQRHQVGEYTADWIAGVALSYELPEGVEDRDHRTGVLGAVHFEHLPDPSPTTFVLGPECHLEEHPARLMSVRD